MKKINFIEFFYTTSEKLSLVLPDWITGKSDVMGQKYHIKYGTGDYSRTIRRNKTRTMEIYLISAVVFSDGFGRFLPGKSGWAGRNKQYSKAVLWQARRIGSGGSAREISGS